MAGVGSFPEVMGVAWLAYPLLGGVTGIIAGLLGVGGGLLMVPLLLIIFRHQGVAEQLVAHLALGTSLAAISCTALASLWAHQQRDGVIWPLFYSLLPGLLLGGWLGGLVAAYLNTLFLVLFFAVFALLTGGRMVLAAQQLGQRELPGRLPLSGVAILIGLVSGLVGIGGGSLMVPFLNYCRVGMVQAVATAASAGLPIALAGTLGYLISGWSVAGRPEGAVGFVYLPALLGIVVTSMLTAPIGAAWAYRCPAAQLKRIFGLFLIIVGSAVVLPFMTA